MSKLFRVPIRLLTPNTCINRMLKLLNNFINYTNKDLFQISYFHKRVVRTFELVSELVKH